jgi:hypothetical protein
MVADEKDVLDLIPGPAEVEERLARAEGEVPLLKRLLTLARAAVEERRMRQQRQAITAAK